MRESKEATMLAQGILMWLLFACGLFTVWVVSAAVAYFVQPAGVPPISRLFWAAISAAVFSGGIFVFIKRFLRLRS